MADQKVTALAENATPATGDILYIVDDPGGTPASQKVTLANVSALVLAQTTFTDHSARHESGGADAIKLDDLAAPDDNTDLNASTTAHGLLPKAPNTATTFLNGQVAYTTPDHGSVGGLTDDDHSQYALLAGRATGQTLIGGTAAGEDLHLKGTAHATPGDVILDNGRFLHPAGTNGLPAVAFSSEATGIYLVAGARMGFAVEGIARAEVNGAGVRVATAGGGILQDVATSATVPFVAPILDLNTGLGSAGADQVSLIAGGTEGLRVEATKATFAGRILGKKGADVASGNDITLGDGNLFDITGTTQINTIASTNWTNGSVVVLQFDASVTVKHNTAGTGAVLLLAGAADFSATAGDMLTLVLHETGWRETARTVI